MSERKAEIYESVCDPHQYHVRLDEWDENRRERWYGGNVILLWETEETAQRMADEFVRNGTIPERRSE